MLNGFFHMVPESEADRDCIVDSISKLVELLPPCCVWESVSALLQTLQTNKSSLQYKLVGSFTCLGLYPYNYSELNMGRADRCVGGADRCVGGPNCCLGN